MNGNVNIDLSKKRMEIAGTIASIEDAGDMIDALKAGARALWPNILFEGEEGFEEAARDADDDGPQTPRAPAPKVRGGGGMTPAGDKPLTAFSQAVLDGLRAGRSVVEIADAQDVTTMAVGAVLGKLRKRGLAPPKGQTP